MDCECIWWKCNEYIFKQMLHILIGANICTHITSWLGQVIEIKMWINKLTMFCAGHRQCQWELRDRLIWCSLCAHQGKLERYFGSSALVLDWTYSWCLVLCLQTLLFTLETDRWKFGFVFSPNFLSFRQENLILSRNLNIGILVEIFSLDFRVYSGTRISLGIYYWIDVNLRYFKFTCRGSQF